MPRDLNPEQIHSLKEKGKIMELMFKIIVTQSPELTISGTAADYNLKIDTSFPLNKSFK